MGNAMRRLKGFARGLGATALSAVLLLALGTGAIRTAGANQQDDRILALAYDPGTDTLLKAQARTLFRSSDRGRSWQTIAIPALENGRIASIAASRAGNGVTFPQIFIGKTYVGGCDELYALDREGRLDGLLASEGVL